MAALRAAAVLTRVFSRVLAAVVVSRALMAACQERAEQEARRVERPEDRTVEQAAHPAELARPEVLRAASRMVRAASAVVVPALVQ